MAKLNVSICTQEIRPYESLEQFIDYLESHLIQAKRLGSDVVLFPEMGNIGLLWTDPTCRKIPPREIGSAYERILTPLFEPFKSAVRALAMKHEIIIMGPTFWHKTDGIGTNTALVAFPDGRIHRQDKIHPTRGEIAIDTRGGNSIGIFEINGIKAGLLICYDSQWPELVRPMVEAGIKVLFVPSLTTKRAYWRVRYATQARAQEGQIYVCVAAIFGNLGVPEEYPLTCTGRAYVTCAVDNRFGVEDGLYAEGPLDEDGLLTVELDMDLVDLSREKGEIRNFSDRRDDLYAALRADVSA